MFAGITDQGLVKGLPLFKCQRDHFRAALDDLLKNRFEVEVPSNRYSVSFVPVRETNQTRDLREPACPEFEHKLRMTGNCICDKYVESMLDDNRLRPLFVIEIEVFSDPLLETMKQKQYQVLEAIRDGLIVSVQNGSLSRFVWNLC